MVAADTKLKAAGITMRTGNLKFKTNPVVNQQNETSQRVSWILELNTKSKQSNSHKNDKVPKNLSVENRVQNKVLSEKTQI